MITMTNLRRFLKGEITWAQVEGITAEEATRYLRMGTTFLERGEDQKAAKVFEALIAINPRDPDPYAMLGLVRQGQGQEAEALALYGKALAAQPRHLVALAYRGELRLTAGDQGGLADLQRAAELDPMGTTASGKRAGNLVRALRLKAASARAAPRVAVRR